MGGHLVVNLISHSSHFTCGVAVAPVTSWRNYGTFFSFFFQSRIRRSLLKFLSTEHVLFDTRMEHSFRSREVASDSRYENYEK